MVNNISGCECSHIGDLRSSGLSRIPASPGVYAVCRKDLGAPRFASKSTGPPLCKGKDPAVPEERLSEKWVVNARVLYIGKAGGLGQNATLRSRIKQFIDFGVGINSGHWGGRYIWQLEDAEELFICWRCTSDEFPGTVEAYLIQSFFDKFVRLPFANLVLGSKKAFPPFKPPSSERNPWAKCLKLITG